MMIVIITDDEICVWTGSTNALGSVSDCYIEQFLDNGYTNLLQALTQTYEANEKME